MTPPSERITEQARLEEQTLVVAILIELDLEADRRAEWEQSVEARLHELERVPAP